MHCEPVGLVIYRLRNFYQKSTNFKDSPYVVCGAFLLRGALLIKLFDLIAIHTCVFHPNNIFKPTSTDIERSNEKTIISHWLRNLDDSARRLLF